MEQNEQKSVFRPGSIKDMKAYIKELMECQKEKDLEAELQSGEALLRLLNSCILSIMRQKGSHQDQYKEICREIRECVNERYRQTNLIASLAGKYEMEEDELDACFQATYGITLRDYILNRRFTAAKELLRFTIKPVKEIIDESGIGNDDLFLHNRFTGHIKNTIFFHFCKGNFFKYSFFKLFFSDSFLSPDQMPVFPFLLFFFL